MKFFMQTSALVWFALASAGPAAAQTRELASSGELIEGIAAVVDEGVVLRSELEMRTDFFLETFRARQAQLPPEQRSALPPASIVEEQVLEQLILKEIQLQRADRLGIVVGDDILNQALSQVAQGLGVTLEQLPAALAAEGVDYEQYRADSRDEIVVGQLEQRDVISRIRVSPRELEQCLERLEETQTSDFDYNVSHILISVSGGASREDLDAARSRAEDIHDRLEAGESFAELAIANSAGPTALEGGSLGWRKGAQLPTIFADVVPEMEPGEISDVIQTGSGFHIVRLNEMRGAERVMVDQVRARHILLAPNELLDDDATLQKIIGIREQILAGDDFATLAIANSEDTVSSADGGDLGWNQADAFVPEFAEKLKSLPIGELSEPFRSPFGWHIVEVTDRRSYDTTEDIKENRCAQEIRASKAEEERLLWLQQLRDQAFVDVRI
ncbi:MAG: peptidylprolyl isomerase [Gammaproteobacteria bacterium]|jgi:peptidyl-prolyl cis-trans isomerase SurA